jgi:signal transduction histidine kinase
MLALRNRLPIKRVVQAGAVDEASVATRFTVDSRRYVVVVRKRLNDVSSAVNAVRTALLRAAIVGLIVAVLVGLGLATALLKRLRRLHEAVHRFGESGVRTEVPLDTSRDEVGDLSRAFGELQARLARQEEVRRAFVSTASHELRTPLMSLAGMLELLEDDLSRDPPHLDDARRQLSGAREQSDRMTRLAADLLDVSRLDAQLELRHEPVEVGELSRAVIAELEGRARSLGSSITLDAHDPTWALADPSATARILRILLDNALRYTPPGDAVQVSVADGDAATVTVTDSGPGVPPVDRERIFNRFTRGSLSTQEGGFGLGLAIGRELAERMGGSLALVDAPAGAAFALVLPRNAEPS